MKMNSYFPGNNYLKRSLFMFLLIISSYLKAQVVMVSGDWAATIPAITEAGSNYAGTYSNASIPTTAITLSTTLSGNFLNVLAGKGAKMTMRYTSNAWNSSLGLSARRTGPTTGTISGVCLLCSATISGGDTFIPIDSNSDTTFFNLNFAGVLGISNTANFSDINLILQLSGVSVTIPAANYSARIIFTVVSN
ncbi:hypothetical protein ACQ7CU_23080 [Chryseobacterium arthrosphaerae]|uniref:hypothetical protein n=1 Tax=Chryseobacterium arthrosphaerae TaxID=651561 RepID=UPI003D344930